jgi:hypothetical protein
MGETIQTELASVKFFVRVKIIVSSPSGTESIDLEEQELIVVSTNEAERQIALSKYNELLYASYNTTSRSKSKSPRRIRRDREQLPSPPASPSDLGSNIAVIPPAPQSASQVEDSRHPIRSSLVSTPYGTKRKKKSHRRPHTSAGPSDSSNDFRIQPGPFERLKPDEERSCSPDKVVADDVPVVVAGDNSGNGETSTTPPSSFGWKRIMAPALSVTTSFPGSLRIRDNVNDSDGKLFEPQIDRSQIRAWEEELARIEIQSRRSSKDIFSIFKRKRVHVARDG